jgi:hypothetical protein
MKMKCKIHNRIVPVTLKWLRNFEGGEQGHLPGEPRARVGLPERDPEAGLLVAAHGRVVHCRQRQPRGVLPGQRPSLRAGRGRAGAAMVVLRGHGRTGGGRTASIRLFGKRIYSRLAAEEGCVFTSEPRCTGRASSYQRHRVHIKACKKAACHKLRHHSLGLREHNSLTTMLQ